MLELVTLQEKLPWLVWLPCPMVTKSLRRAVQNEEGDIPSCGRGIEMQACPVLSPRVIGDHGLIR